MPNAEPFADRLAHAIDRVGSPVCVGLDPVLEKLPEAVRSGAVEPVEALSGFCHGVLEAVAGLAPAVKLQSACFERFGDAGLLLLRELVEASRALGLISVLDAKRGDIGISAEHYAAAAFDHLGADALTVSGYLGPDTLEAFVRPGAGLFVLVRTSNPGSDAVQSLPLADGRTVAEMMADHVRTLGARHLGASGLSGVGAVVAATKPGDGPALRARMPDQVFLVPGYGAQGGTPEDLRGMLRSGGRSPGHAGVLVTASRSVIYPGDAGPRQGWQDRVRSAAGALAREIAGVVRG
jgi:orotidine-5'-phosphate decarboxylase